MIFFTADEHFGHGNIIKHCNRPFKNVEEMNTELTIRWNAVVRNEDTVYVLGDFAWRKDIDYAKHLNGRKIFLRGSHGKEKEFPYVMEVQIEGQHIVLCHYAMRSWPRSFHGSWHLYGHSHGRLPGYGFSMDVGVDTHQFYPYSWQEIKDRMILIKESPLD